MSTQYVDPYGYPYPQPVDPARDGAANIEQLARTLHPVELFSGQPCLAGSLPTLQNWRVKQMVYNYAVATDQYGLFSVPLPFTQCCVSAFVIPRNFRDPVVTVALAQEYCTITVLTGFARNAAGAGIPSTNLSVGVMAWGY